MLVAGNVVFLGAFSAAQSEKIMAPQPEGIPFGTELSIRPVEISPADAQRMVAEPYPAFARAPLLCLTCTAEFAPARRRE